MYKYLILFALPIISFGQQAYIAQKSQSLSAAAAVITVQQPATGGRSVEFKSAYVGCSVACTVTLERNGANTFASTTALTVANVNPNEVAASATAFYDSNVGTGTVLNIVQIAAGSFIVFDLTGVYLPAAGGKGANMTLRTSAITGNTDISIKWTER